MRAQGWAGWGRALGPGSGRTTRDSYRRALPSSGPGQRDWDGDRDRNSGTGPGQQDQHWDSGTGLGSELRLGPALDNGMGLGAVRG